MINASLISVPVWIGLILATIRYGLAFDKFCQKVAFPSTTRAVCAFLSKTSSKISIFPTVLVLFPRFPTLYVALKKRTIRFIIIYGILTLLVVLSFGAFNSVLKNYDLTFAFLWDMVIFSPGAFLAYWTASTLNERALNTSVDVEGFKRLTWAALFSVAIGFILLNVSLVSRIGWDGWDSIDLITGMLANLTFLNPRMLTATWQLFDQFGNRTNNMELSLLQGGPAQFKIVTYHSQFTLFFSIVSEAVFTWIITAWLCVFRSYDRLHRVIAKYLDVKQHPYFFAILPPVLILELIGLMVALVTGLSPSSSS